MRSITKKRLKIVGISLATMLVAVLGSLAVFVFNPFEGSLPDMRYAAPRDVDFFLRKVDLTHDFSEFPEPWFWEELSHHPDWAAITRGPSHASLNGRGEITAALEQLSDQVELIAEQTNGHFDLLDDVLGNEIQVAGRLPRQGIGQTSWCAYARVTWRAKFAWGLLDYGFVRERMRQNGLHVIREDELVMIQPMGVPGPREGGQLRPDGAPLDIPVEGASEPMYAARHLDCLMLGNDRELVRRSWELAAGIGDPESFGGSPNYQDGVRGRLIDWEKVTGVSANALEFYVKPVQLFALPGVTFDDNWPDPHDPDDMNSRVMAAFVNLGSWLGLTGSLVFEEGSMSLLANIELNQNEHTPFQEKFFRTESQQRSDWLDPFLRMVPTDACALAAMRMPAGEFLHEMYAAMDDATQALFNDALDKTGKYHSVPDLIDFLEPAFHPRTGFVFRKNRPDPGPDSHKIVVAAPSPMPQVAWVFWLRKGGDALVHEFVEMMTRYREVIGLDAWNYPLDLGGAGRGVAGDAAREFAHPQIPATGSIATLIYGDFFVISNSGPFIRDMMHSLLGNRDSISDQEDFQEYSQELPNAVNGFIYLQGRELERLLGDYEQDIVDHAQRPDPTWAMNELPAAEHHVFKEKYSQYGSTAGLPPSVRADFDNDVNAEIESRWRTKRTSYTAEAQASILESMALCRLFESAYIQLTLEPRYLRLTGRTIARFR